MGSQEKREIIEQAIALVIEAKELVDAVMDEHPLRANYEAYGKYGFNQLLDEGNPYDSSLNTIIESLDDDE